MQFKKYLNSFYEIEECSEHFGYDFCTTLESICIYIYTKTL